jgi:hypothetical protein
MIPIKIAEDPDRVLDDDDAEEKALEVAKTMGEEGIRPGSYVVFHTVIRVAPKEIRKPTPGGRSEGYAKNPIHISSIPWVPAHSGKE